MPRYLKKKKKKLLGYYKTAKLLFKAFLWDKSNEL